MAPYVMPGLAIAVSLFCVLFGLGAYPLLQPDEGRNAEVAREMLESAAWLVPTYNSLPYLDKPAFYFKAVAFSLGLFGENEAAARAVSALSGIATLALIYRFCRRHYDATTAATAVMVIATAPLFIAFSRIVIFDMTLAFFVSAAILACFEAGIAECSARRGRYYGIAAMCIGFATLVKGPVGFVLPTLVIAAYQASERNRGWWRGAFGWRNLAIFFAVFLPWFIGLSLQQPDFPYYGIVKESLQRFTTNEFHRAAPFYYYGVIIALCFLPWSVLLPEGVLLAWRERRSLGRADRLFAIWAVVVMLFFSLSQSKLPGYILTAVIALGVLTGRLFAGAIERSASGRSPAIVRRGSLILAMTALLAFALVCVPLLDPSVLSRLPPKTAAHLTDIGPLFRPLAWLLAVTAGLALYGFICRDAWRIAAFLIFPLVLVFVTTQQIGAYAGNRSARDLAQRLPAMSQDSVLACYMCFPNGLPFYAKRPITVVSFQDGRELESNYIRFKLLNAPVWPDTMVREGGFRQWIDTRRQPVYLLTKSRDLAKVSQLLAGRPTHFSHLAAEYWGVWLAPEPGQ